MGIHPWWAGFGQAVTSPDDLTSPAARELASAIAAGTVPAVTLTGLKERATTGHSAVALEIEVERPQDLALPHSRDRAGRRRVRRRGRAAARARLARRFSRHAASELDAAGRAVLALHRRPALAGGQADLSPRRSYPAYSALARQGGARRAARHRATARPAVLRLATRHHHPAVGAASGRDSCRTDRLCPAR